MPDEFFHNCDVDKKIDAQGMYVSAGFIELHTHGIDGYDFMDNKPDELLDALKAYAKYGVTGLFPTTLSCPYDELINVLDGFSKIDFSKNEGSTVLGLHLEGPYFNKEQCGAQATDYLSPPIFSQYSHIIDTYPMVKRWDLAPESDTQYKMIKYLKDNHKVAGIAHTNAGADQVIEAVENGCTIAAHLYSGMSSVHRKNGFRYGGAVEGCLLSDNIATELICDGIHLPKELLQLAYKIKGPDNICLVTDSVRGTGLSEGSQFILGNKNSGTRVFIADGVAWMPDKSSFAGSIATFNKLIWNAVYLAKIPLASAITMGTKTPARVMNVKNKGELKKSYDADIIIFDEDINIKITMINGITVLSCS